MVGWLPENQWIATARILGNNEAPADDLAPYGVLAASAGWWWLNRGVVVLSDRPLAVHLDEHRRLHRTDGPAVVYEDGFSVNVIDGILLPDWYFEDGAVTVDRIEAEPNMEIRRLLIDRIGGDRYMADAGGRLVHEDDTGQLWSVVQDIHRGLRLDVRLVRVVDATPQADDSRRVYWIHVPPFVDTARAAVAWTFGLDADQYSPQVET